MIVVGLGELVSSVDGCGLGCGGLRKIGVVTGGGGVTRQLYFLRSGRLAIIRFSLAPVVPTGQVGSCRIEEKVLEIWGLRGSCEWLRLRAHGLFDRPSLYCYHRDKTSCILFPPIKHCVSFLASPPDGEKLGDSWLPSVSSFESCSSVESYLSHLFLDGQS